MKFLTVYDINLLCSALCLILIFSSPQPTRQAVITSYGLQDLETNDIYFISDTNLWTHSSLSPSNPDAYTFCSQRYILGGKGALANSLASGAYFTKTYTDLPDHAYIKFTIHLWIMQGWPSTDKLLISFDGVPYAGFNTGLGSVPDTLTMQSYTTDQCGGTWLADVGLFRLYGGFTHTDSSITVTISGNIAQDSYTVAFGFRNVTMQFAAAAPTSLPSRCLLASSTVVPGGSTPYVAYSPYTCACPEGMYYDSTSGCLTCHMSCLSCYAASAKGCWRCQEGYQFDGTSCVSCGSSCTVCNGRGGLYDSQNVCRECTSMTFAYLLPSESGHYFLLNLAPDTCNLDEAAVAKYLNGYAIDSDVFPSFSFVITPLLDKTYLVELKLEKSLVYTTDLNITMQYLQATVSVPRKFIESDTLQSLHNVFKVGKIILIVIIVLSIFGTTALGTPEALWSFVNLLQFMSFLRFLNIPYPKLVEQFLAIGQAADWSMVPNLLGLVSIPESDDYLDSRLLTAESDFYQNSLPAGEYIHTSDASYFLYNAGAIIIGTTIVLLFVLIVLATGNGSRDGSSLLMRSFRDTIRWNFTIRFYLITGIPLALWICLQLRYFGFDNNYQSACSVLTLLFSLYFVVMLVSVIRILKNQESENKSRFKRLFGTLTVGMATDKHGGKYYHFFVFLRGILIALLIGFVETIPFLQISLLIYCNVGIVYYLFQQAVFVDTKLQTINKAKELLVLFSEIWLLCINVQVDSISYYNVMEWLVISTLGPAGALELFYLVGLQLIGAGTIFAKVKKLGQYCQVCFKTARNPPTRLQGGRRTRNDGNINDETDIGG